MHREYRRWHSPSLNREMELLVVGHAGAPLLVWDHWRRMLTLYLDGHD